MCRMIMLADVLGPPKHEDPYVRHPTRYFPGPPVLNNRVVSGLPPRTIMVQFKTLGGIALYLGCLLTFWMYRWFYEDRV